MRRLSVRNVGIIVVGLALLYAVIQSTRPKDVEDFTELEVGANTIDLSSGDYTLYWQTLAHPDEEAEFADFELGFRPDD